MLKIIIYSTLTYQFRSQLIASWHINNNNIIQKIVTIILKIKNMLDSTNKH